MPLQILGQTTVINMSGCPVVLTYEISGWLILNRLLPRPGSGDPGALRLEN